MSTKRQHQQPKQSQQDQIHHRTVHYISANDTIPDATMSFNNNSKWKQRKQQHYQSIQNRKRVQLFLLIGMSLLIFIVALIVVIPRGLLYFDVDSKSSSNIIQNYRKNKQPSSSGDNVLKNNDALRYLVQSILHQQQQPHDYALTDVTEQRQEVLELDHEEQFLSTIKSCIPERPNTSNNNEEQKKKKRKTCNEFLPTIVDGSEIPQQQQPKQKHLQEGASSTQTTIQRIALIAPPGFLSVSLFRLMQSIATEYNTDTSNNEIKNSYTNPIIKIISTTHVPPYGYGKTHGLTKIVRLVPRPLLSQVFDTIQYYSSVSSLDHRVDEARTTEEEEEERDKVVLIKKAATTAVPPPTIDAVTIVLRQMIRFHCRLSHVAAHTAITSISSYDLVQDPESVYQHLREFLLLSSSNTTSITSSSTSTTLRRNEEGDANDKKNIKYYSDGHDDIDFDGTVQYNTRNVKNTIERIMKYTMSNGIHIIDSIQKQYNVNITQILDNVLLDELEKTKNLSKWPCEPFWDHNFETNKSNNNNKNKNNDNNSTFIWKWVAKSVSPNCTDPFVSCFVPLDTCEHLGNINCAK